MGDPLRQAWSDVADEFSSLGSTLRDRYQPGSAGGPGGGPSAAEEAQAALRDVFDRLVAATREFGERAGDVLHDEDVQGQARHAVRSLGDALVATAELIGTQIGDLFRTSPAGPGRGDRSDPESTGGADRTRSP